MYTFNGSPFLIRDLVKRSPSSYKSLVFKFKATDIREGGTVSGRAYTPSRC